MSTDLHGQQAFNPSALENPYSEERNDMVLE